MGLLCSHINDNYNKKVICYKCDYGYFPDKGGSYSTRMSCRYHHFNENNFCLNCHKFKKKCIKSHCYHVKKSEWCSQLC